MTKQQILEKAIKKAIEGGWNIDLETVLPEMQKKWSLYGLQYTGYSGLLFSHDFAKALWGEEEAAEVITRWHRQSNTRDDWIGDLVPEWKRHLQQMVISPDPIQYLGEHI